MNTSHLIPCPHAGGTHDVHALIWPAQAPSSLPPLVCVHGLTRLGLDFEAVAARLSRARTVIALDMPGRGKSAWLADVRLYAYPQYVADCLHVLRTLGFSRVDWLGTSMGGLIGLFMAAGEGSPIRKLVLNDVGPFLPLSALKRIGDYVARTPRFATLAEAERHCRAIYADFGITGDAAWKRFTETTMRAAEGGGYVFHYDPGIAQVFTSVREDINLWPVYEKLQLPVLVLRGVRSDVLLEDTARMMQACGPKAGLITFAGCGHAPALQNDEQLAALEGFFS